MILGNFLKAIMTISVEGHLFLWKSTEHHLQVDGS